MGRTRLDGEAPEVAEHLRYATPQALRAFICQSCDRAVVSSGLEDPLVPQASRAMRTSALEVELASSLESLAERIDQEYLVAQVRSDPRGSRCSNRQERRGPSGWDCSSPTQTWLRDACTRRRMLWAIRRPRMRRCCPCSPWPLRRLGDLPGRRTC